MLAIIAALGLALAGADAAAPLSDIGRSKPVGSCRLTAPEQCARSGEWITDDPKFERAIINFFKTVPNGRFGNRNEAASHLFIRTVYGPHVDPDRIAPGIYLFSACLMHDCPGRQATVVVGKGRILAAAMSGHVCDRCPYSTYIFVKKSEVLFKTGVTALMEWAANENKGDPYLYLLP